MYRVAAVTILYNPPENFLENLNTYLSQVDHIYIIDNSNEELSIKFSNKKITYKANYLNIGIAKALNLGAELAIQKKYDFILMMDQDSSVEKEYVENLLKVFSKKEDIALAAPIIIHERSKKKIKVKNNGYNEINVAMTSGSLLRLEAYKKGGPFLDKLFIDYVDNEYCLRLKKNGFSIIKNNSVYLYHILGNATEHNFLFRKVYPTNHSSLRLYYRSRNRMYVYKKYFIFFPMYVIGDLLVWSKEIFKIILFEKDKYKKLKMSIIGIFDFVRNKYGKY